MQHPTPPTAEPLFEKPQFSLSAARRKQINDALQLPPAGLAVAVNHPPGPRKAHLTIVKLPRSSSGKPPRRGVHIPLPAYAQKSLCRVSKHARQQRRDGKFGNQGKATIERKLELLNASRAEALIHAVKRTAKRVSSGCVQGVAKAYQAFSDAYRRAREVVGFERLTAEVRA